MKQGFQASLNIPESLQTIVSKIIAKAKTLKQGQQLACNCLELLGYQCNYVDWKDALWHVCNLNFLEVKKVPNGYGGWDYIHVKTGLGTKG